MRLELTDRETGLVVVGLSAAQLRRLGELPADELARSLRVYTANARPAPSGQEPPPVLGRVELSDIGVRWRPSFPLAPGQPYLAVWTPPESLGAGSVEHRFSLARDAEIETPRVLALAPAVESVPANLLRVYVQFSRPMREGRATDFVRVLGDGEPIEGALVPTDEELWNGERDRLTLLFDPGRIKQGVGPNVEVGSPLREGMRLEVRVEPGWPARGGAALTEGAARSWRVGPPDRTRPEVPRWELSSPSGPEAPVVVAFDEPLDPALVIRLGSVETEAGERVAGSGRLVDGGRGWSFRPDAGWEPGGYRVRFGSELEDLAGNSLERLFDEPLDPERVGERERSDAILEFEVQAL